MLYSVFDTNIPVEQDNFVVSILRKPHSNEPEHAFLLVEGINVYGKAIIRRYDFMQDTNSKYARVIIKKEVMTEPNQIKTEILDNVLRGEEVYSRSFSISKEQARNLHNDILNDQQNPPLYQVKADTLLAQSSSLEGDSAFTWARKKLLNLNDERINLKATYSDFVDETEHNLKGNNADSSACLLF